MADLCAMISSMTGLPVSVQNAPALPDVAESAPTGRNAAGRDPLDESLRAALNAPSSGQGQIKIKYTGTVNGLLNHLAAKSSLSWDYTPDTGVTFLASSVKTFIIHAAPGKVSFSNTITNQSEKNNTGSSIGGSTSVQVEDTSIQTAQKNTTDLTFDIWADVEKEIKGLLNPGGSVTINQAAGTVTVRAAPSVLHQVGRYIDDLNARLSRQVALSIKVWSLEVDDTTEAGLNLGLFFENPNIQVFSGSSPLNFLNLGGEISAAVVDGKLKNSTALLKGLRSIGNATQVTSGGGVALSNQPVPIQAIRRDAYLAGSSRSQNEYGDTTTLTPGEVTTGFAMTVIPHILEGRRLVLQYTINLSSLDAMEEFSSGDSTIQLPKVSSRSFSQRMTLKMGQTLVLAGFEQEIDGRGSTAGFLALGRTREYKKSLMVITISTESGDV
jgi:type IVB pilus formation R64 PilN family outer membrane protein